MTVQNQCRMRLSAALSRPLLASILLLAFAVAKANPSRVIPLWPEGVPDARPASRPERIEQGRVFDVQVPTLLAFILPVEKAGGASVIVLPGGGYKRLALEKEGVEIARWLNSLGLHAFVLKYRVGDTRHPAPLQDALQAIRIVRSLSRDIGSRPDRVGLIGFSAGGHLAATAATMFADLDGQTGGALDHINARPDLLVLVYPVITFTGQFVHVPTCDTLLGPDAAPELTANLSPDRRVSPTTPTTIVFHAVDDTAVPFENSLEFYLSLRKAGVPARLCLLERGGHGFGLRSTDELAGGWSTKCKEWLRDQGWLQPANPVESRRPE